MSLRRLWAFLAVALPALGALIAGLSSVDLTYHLRAGGQILDSGAIPTMDTWTFTAAGLPWIDQQWGAQVLLAMIYRFGGWTALVLLRAALVGLISWCLFEIGRRRGLGLRLAALVALAAFLVSAATLGLRPQLLGMALFAGVLLLVADRRQHPGRLWIVPLLVLVWANIHGSFFLGPLAVGLAWLEDLHDRATGRQQTLAVTGLAALAACITPFGPAVWLYAIGLSTNPEVTRLISEWQPTTLREVPGILFFGSALGVATLLARRGRPAPWPTLIWLGVFFAIGAYAIRGVAWWGPAAAMAVAGLLADGAPADSGVGEPSGTPTLRRLNVAFVMAIVLAGTLLLPIWRPPDGGQAAPQGVLTSAPSGLTASLRTLIKPGDRLFNPQVWGSWFEFAFPELPVAIDSRIEVIPARIWDLTDAVETGADGWEGQLATWGVSIVVAQASNTAFAARLVAAGWRSVYTDQDGSILLAPGRS